MKRTPIKRGKPPRRMSAKKRAELPELIAFRAAVLARAKVPGGWECDRCRRLFRYADQIEAHHRLPRSQAKCNDPSNGAALCSVIDPYRVNCHTAVELHLDDGLSHWSEWIVTRNEMGKPA